MSKVSTVRLALVGAGGLGGAWAKIIAGAPNVTLAAIVDPLIGTDKQSAWLSDFPDVEKVRSIAEVTGTVDAAHVTAFSTAHATAIRDALEHDLHVLVEKPFTTSMADAEAVVELAAKKKLTLMVSQNYRFFPGSAFLRELAAGGRYGAVASIFGEFWCDWPGKPYQHGMKHVMGLEMAVHHFDMVRAIFGVDPAGGYVREWQQAGSQYAGGGAMEAIFDMAGPQGSFPFTYSGSLVGKAPRTPWPGVWRIEFDKETVVVDTVADRYGIYRAHADGFEWLAPMNDEMHFDSPLAHFIDCIGSGKEPWSSGRDNLGTLKMALGAEVFGPG